MKKILAILTLLLPALVPVLVHAQGGNTISIQGTGAPSGSCSFIMRYVDSSTGNLYNCKAGAWNLVGGASAPGTVTNIATTSPITGGPITGTGTIACAGCVTASSPGAGIAHFAGSTQAVTSSLIVGADINSSTALPNGVTATTQTAGDSSTKVATTAYVDAKSSGGWSIPSGCDLTGLTDALSANGSFTTTCVLPANSLKSGANIKLKAGIVESLPGGCTADLQYTLKEGSTTIMGPIGHSSANGTGFGAAIDANLQVVKTGASGILNGLGGVSEGGGFIYQENNTSTGPQLAFTGGHIGQDSTASQTLSIAVSGFAGTGCTVTLNSFLVAIQQP